MAFFAPFPFFLNLSNFEIILETPTFGDLYTFFGLAPKFPLPIVFFVVFYIYASYFLGNILRDGRLKFVSKKAFVLCLLFFLFLGVAVLGQGAGLIAFLQVFLFLILSVLIPTLSDKKVLGLARSYLYGISTWGLLHIGSIVWVNDFSVFNVDRYFNYGTIFGLQIYQSLVSYPATMSLFVLFAIYCVVRTRLPVSLATAAGVSSVGLGFFSATRMFQLDIVIISFFMLYIIIKSRLKVSHYIFFLVMFLTILFGFTNYSGRLLEQGASDRFKLMSDAVDAIVSDPNLLLFGTGLAHSFAHNYFLNFILNFGLLNFFVFLLATTLVLRNIWKKLSVDAFDRPFIFVLFIIILTNSFFNTAITQPMFLCNALIAFLVYVGKLSSQAQRSPFFASRLSS